MTASKARAALRQARSSSTVRSFNLHLAPPSRSSSTDGYGIRLDESFGDGERRLATTIATASPLQASRLLDALVAAVRASGRPVTTLSPLRRRPIVLDEAAGVRLAIAIFAIQRVTKPARIGQIVAAVGAMSTEETYYWYAKAVGPDADRIRRALRIFLAQE
jgi:hypothetical protein